MQVTGILFFCLSLFGIQFGYALRQITNVLIVIWSEKDRFYFIKKPHITLCDFTFNCLAYIVTL